MGLLLGLGLAIPLGLITGLLGYGYVNLKREAVRRGWPLVEAVVAYNPPATGATLMDHHLAIRSVPAQMVTDDVVPAAQGTTAVGRRLRAPVAHGQLLRWSFMEEAQVHEAPGQRVARVCPPGGEPRSDQPSQTVQSFQKLLAEEALR